MRQTWVFLVAGLAMCASLPALPSVGARTIQMARGTPSAHPSEHLVEDTVYVTEGIEVDASLLPLAKGAGFRPGDGLAPGVGVDAGGRLHGTPERTGTYTTPVQVCQGDACVREHVTVVVLPNVPWTPRLLTFPGRVGERLEGRVQIEGGPAGVPPTFTVTDAEALPAGVTIGPDGQVGGVPATAGVSRVPVRVCVGGNCAGVVVTLIVL